MILQQPAAKSAERCQFLRDESKINASVCGKLTDALLFASKTRKIKEG